MISGNTVDTRAETVFTEPMTTLTSNQNQTALTEAYHAVFDAKDKLPSGSQSFYLAYEALGKIADLMTSLGFDSPSRFDGEGRKS